MTKTLLALGNFESGKTTANTPTSIKGGELVGDLSTFVDKVKRLELEVEEPDTSTRTGQITKGTNNGSVDGALVLSAGCVCRKVDRVVSREGGISLAVSLSMASLLVVRVLVLSEHRIVTPASS